MLIYTFTQPETSNQLVWFIQRCSALAQSEFAVSYAIWKSYSEVAPYVEQVISIADSNKGAFGFLANSAYERMASKNQLWIVIESETSLVGYLMFGGTMPTLKISQIYVCKSAAGNGIGKMLIRELVDHAKSNHFHTIAARVASDLPANKFWEKVGFKTYRQVRGSEVKKRIINIRGYSLESNDLLGGLGCEQAELTPSGPLLKRPVYALDLNLLIDLVEAREGFEKVTRLIQIGFEGGLSICVTPEFKTELKRHSKNSSDDMLLRLAHVFPELRAGNDIVDVANNLKTIIFPNRDPSGKSATNNQSDLLHLAYCISAGVNGFITHEKALLRFSAEITKKYGVSIFAPEELIVDDTDLQSSSSPMYADFTLRTVSNSFSKETQQFLKDFSAPTSILNEIFNRPFLRDNQTVSEARMDNKLFAVYYFKKPVQASHTATACIYVDERFPKAVAAIDHFLELILRYKCSFSYRLDLHIGRDQALTVDTLRRKGFFKLENHYVKFITDTFLESKNWPKFQEEIKLLCGLELPEKLPSKKALINTGIFIRDSLGNSNTLTWFEFETVISPRFILNPDRKCVLVSIRENYADSLIGNIKNQMSLLSSHDTALFLEKAYFRSTSKASFFSKGTIIAFYVSGSIQEIIGFARITYSDVVKVDDALVNLARQGVLTRDELSDLADDNDKLHAFTFDNFLEFTSRVSFQDAKALGLISKANLVSPEIIDLGQLKTLIGIAFNE